MGAPLPTPIHYLEVYQCPYTKKRYGAKRDGGYAVCETDVKYDVLLSCGISSNITFENDFLKEHNIPCYGFDGTIKSLPQNQYATDKIQWINKNITRHNNEHETNLIEYIQNYNDIFLKMDIESWEFDVFQVLTAEHLQRISQITIEVHGLGGFKTIDNVRYTKMDLFTHLNKTHTLLHAHANNAVDSVITTKDGYRLPHLLELTFVRTSDILKQFPNFTKSLNVTPYPQSCDYPNITKKEEISLNYYPFLKEV
jgi:hypothetical protein